MNGNRTFHSTLKYQATNIIYYARDDTTEMAKKFNQMLYQKNIKHEQTNKLNYDGWTLHPNKFTSIFICLLLEIK